MKNTIVKQVLAAGFAAGLAIASSAYAVPGDNGIHPEGEAAADNLVNRVITITPDTKWANVMEDDVVKFVDAQSGQSFVWSFDTPGWGTVDLNKVAPPGFISGRDVVVYVSEPLHH